MLKMPVIRGLIDRRILVNYRVDPAILQRLLPAPLRPKCVNGAGVAGICLIRLRRVRPRGWPGVIGFGSENAAHRIAVEWDDPDGTARGGVYIPRRDSSSRLNEIVGGRIFPGVHHHARFNVRETNERYRIAIASDDGKVRIRLDALTATFLPPGSVFRNMDEASAFFQGGSLGYSPDAAGTALQGLELRTFSWRMSPLAIWELKSSYFEDESLFPRGSATPDCALLMRHVEHEWHEREAPAAAQPVAVCEQCVA
jgi:hypothetical protein